MSVVVQMDRDFGDANASIFNVAPVQSGGTVLVMFNLQPSWCNTVALMYEPRCRETHVIESADAAHAVWSKPRNITSQLVGGANPPWTRTRNPTAVTPGPGLELSDGTLLVPGYGCSQPAGATCVTYALNSTMRSWALLSTDKGQHWRLGGESDAISAAEPMVAQIPGSDTLLMNARSLQWPHDDKPHPDRFRLYSTSSDRGDTWAVAAPGAFAPLVGPSCQASFVSSGRDLLFANPANQVARLDMTLRVSTDAARTWQSHLVYPNSSWYSTVHSSKERRRPLFWQPFWTVTEPAPGLLVPLSGFLASRRREQRKNGEKMRKNGRDTAI